MRGAVGDDVDMLPVDPDLDPGLQPRGVRRSAWPRLHPDVVAVVFVGGCLGGWARYAAGTTWPAARGAFPWSTFGVNVVGAFVLAVVVVLATELLQTRYLRAFVGTGFCGALTTFSSVVVGVDELFAQHHLATAIVYLVATIAAGLLAAFVGLVAGRSVAANRHRSRERRRPS